MGSVTVAWEDVISVIHLISTHLIVLAVLLAAAIIVVIVSSLKLKKPKKGLVNGSALIAFGLAAVLIVNMMLTGPLYNTLNVNQELKKQKKGRKTAQKSRECKYVANKSHNTLLRCLRQ